jgi:hypothetical protein
MWNMPERPAATRTAALWWSVLRFESCFAFSRSTTLKSPPASLVCFLLGSFMHEKARRPTTPLLGNHNGAERGSAAPVPAQRLARGAPPSPSAAQTRATSTATSSSVSHVPSPFAARLSRECSTEPSRSTSNAPGEPPSAAHTATSNGARSARSRYASACAAGSYPAADQ